MYFRNASYEPWCLLTENLQRPPPSSQVLKEGDLITRDFHRSTLSVQEEQPPDEDERLAEEERVLGEGV